MNVFIDTEFVHEDFVDMDLISLGLVSADGAEFYGERDDFDPGLMNDFVRSFVMPLLRADGAAVYSKAGLRDAAAAWLGQFEAEGVVICYDNISDWSLLCDLFDKNLPSWIKPRNIRDHLDFEVKKRFFDETKLPEHHALYDAHSNRFAMRIDPFHRFRLP